MHAVLLASLLMACHRPPCILPRLLHLAVLLQELLEFTLIHHAQLAGDDELFGCDDEEGAGHELLLPEDSPSGQHCLPTGLAAVEAADLAPEGATLAALPSSS